MQRGRARCSDVERAQTSKYEKRNTDRPPHTYTTRNENIPASFGLLSAIKRIPPGPSRGRSAQRAPSKTQIYLRASGRAALLKISLAIFHCDHRN